MKENFDKSLAIVLKHEGGFTNDKRDPGNSLPDGREGSTMLGVTQANWENYVGHAVTQDDMKKLTVEAVKPFYKQRYWNTEGVERKHATKVLGNRKGTTY